MSGTVRTSEIDEAIIDKLAEGLSLSVICAEDGMPTRRTVQRWQDDDPDFYVAVTRAREIGLHARAEKAVEDAKAAKDAALGRLAFDAERWYVGKLSNAFNDKVKLVGGGEGDAPIRTEAKLDLSNAPEEVLKYLASQVIDEDRR